MDIDLIKYFIINKLLIFISTSRTLPLGFRLTGDTLRFGPCVPSGWLGYEITYRHRSATYRVRVENPAGAGCGVRSVTVDGRPAPDGSVPLRDDGQAHDVRVTLG